MGYRGRRQTSSRADAGGGRAECDPGFNPRNSSSTTDKGKTFTRITRMNANYFGRGGGPGTDKRNRQGRKGPKRRKGLLHASSARRVGFGDFGHYGWGERGWRRGISNGGHRRCFETEQEAPLPCPARSQAATDGGFGLQAGVDFSRPAIIRGMRTSRANSAATSWGHCRLPGCRRNCWIRSASSWAAPCGAEHHGWFTPGRARISVTWLGSGPR